MVILVFLFADYQYIKCPKDKCESFFLRIDMKQSIVSSSYIMAELKKIRTLLN